MAADWRAASSEWIYVKYKCYHSDGKLSDLYLIETNGSELLYDVSLKAAESDAAKLSQESISVLESRGMEHSTAMKVGIALEEITANMSVINAGPVDFDVRILDSGRDILLALRDNGIEFNPIEYQPSAEEESDYRSDRIIVLRALASDIKYDRVLSLNQTLHDKYFNERLSSNGNKKQESPIIADSVRDIFRVREDGRVRVQ